MTSYTASYTPSGFLSEPDATGITFGTDVSQDPVFLSAEVRPSRAFARAMLALGRVARMKETGITRDHTDYQQWVWQQYLKELPAESAAAAIKLPGLYRKREPLARQERQLVQQAVALAPPGEWFGQQRRQFWKWLYEHDREAWIVLDPIVSVQADATFFEAFSADESMYVRVELPTDELVADQPLRLGTTNIDFSTALEREFARTRSYRPIHLTVGSSSVGLRTESSAVIERKIDLPDSWVRSLVEVQAALPLASTELTLSAGMVADIIARLEAQREKRGPRGLAFELVPGRPPTVRIEPWGDLISDTTSTYPGPEPKSIKMWGRRRLAVLSSLLPHTDSVSVRLGESGMPSFWTVKLDGVTFTLGLSGWSAMNWAGKARFSAMVAPSTVGRSAMDKATTLLQKRGAVSVDDAAEALNLLPQKARSVLQRLCALGKAMWDYERNIYRWRPLFPNIDLAAETDTTREERKGVEIARSKNVRVDIADSLEEGRFRREATVDVEGQDFSVLVDTDVDGSVTYAQCSCSYFRHNRMRQGPCRHIIATVIAESVS